MNEPLEAMREEWAHLVCDFLHRVSHDLRVPFDLSEEAEELRGAMEKLEFWEMVMPEKKNTFADMFDTYYCPTHGKRRRSQGEVRQAERDEVCLYVCTDCGEVADPECFDGGPVR